MAAPRNRKTNRTSPPKKPASFVFWTLFFIVIISLFFLNLQLIRSSVQRTGFLDRFFNKPDVADAEHSPAPEPPPELLPQALPAAGPVEEAPEALTRARPEEGLPDSGAAESPAGTEDGAPQAEPYAPAAAPAAPRVTPPPAASRDQALYFIEVDGDGAILRTRVIRSLPATDSPLADTMQILLQGPTVDERNRGLITLIPPGAKFQSAQIRGSTAYLSFNEEFQFNTYGVEGYIGQLRQIIWTATEFPNVADVQILIEGRRIDYLGERIAIGSPLGRNSF